MMTIMHDVTIDSKSLPKERVHDDKHIQHKQNANPFCIYEMKNDIDYYINETSQYNFRCRILVWCIDRYVD